ncbi:MAG: hypothetical protein Ta2B_13940 [Termitinemataceae bacterium]|nr:MAG: hypothetical protein Ta2B_13940 [Termitinemataceae bacterium]
MKSIQELTTKELGNWGEGIVAQHFKEIGYSILARNWHHSRYGEVDVVASRDGELHIIEVKTRRSVRSGYPIEAVTHKKYEQIRKISNAYLHSDDCADTWYKSIHIDVIGVLVHGEIYELKELMKVALYD